MVSLELAKVIVIVGCTAESRITSLVNPSIFIFCCLLASWGARVLSFGWTVLLLLLGVAVAMYASHVPQVQSEWIC